MDFFLVVFRITLKDFLKGFTVKLADVVNIKLSFMDWFFYNLIILINAKFHTKIKTKKPGMLSDILKTSTSSNYGRVEYFLMKFCTRFLLRMSTKRCSVFFLI